MFSSADAEMASDSATDLLINSAALAASLASAMAIASLSVFEADSEVLVSLFFSDEQLSSASGGSISSSVSGYNG